MWIFLPVCKGKNCYGTLRNSHLPTCLTQGHDIKYLSTNVVMVLVRRLEFRNATQRSSSWAEVRASHTLQFVPEAMPLPGKKSPDSCIFSCARLEDTQVWKLCSSHLFRGLLCWYARENSFQPLSLTFPATVWISLAAVEFWCSFPSCPWKVQFLEVLMGTKYYSSFQFLVSKKSTILSVSGSICWKFVKLRRNK